MEYANATSKETPNWIVFNFIAWRKCLVQTAGGSASERKPTHLTNTQSKTLYGSGKLNHDPGQVGGSQNAKGKRKKPRLALACPSTRDDASDL